ncbi:MAG: glycosyltransferase [Gammaproteobacteria bacterium]|nr:glycosyltransferase [Gammaproteobacteria bacterium]
MKILHIIDSDGIYGAEVMLLNLMREHVLMGHEPIILSIEDNHNESKYSLYQEATKRGLSAIKVELKRGFRPGSSALFMKIAKENSIDIIHSHGYKGNILLGIIPKIQRSTPVISTIHGWTSVRKFSKLWIYSLLDKFFLKRLDAVVYVNPLTPNVIHHKKAFHIDNGIPEHQFNRQIIEKTDQETVKFCQDGYIIGCISRLSEEKGIANLIEAISLALNKLPDIKLLIIGDGPLLNELKQLVNKYGISSSVLFSGYRENAYNYLAFFDLFILPSITEGLPITVLEAMQASVPVIATKVGAIPKVLANGDNGIIVNPNDSRSIEKAIYLARSQPELLKFMIIRSKNDVAEKYSCHRMANDYINVYNKVMNNGKH